MNEYELLKLLKRGTDALERIATALEKMNEQEPDNSGRSVRGFGVGGTD